MIRDDVMISITKDDFIKMFVKNNEDHDISELKEALDEAVNDKSNGVKCSNCGQPMWAVGSAVAGWDGCFACISEETDDSEDYEIDTVCK